ncbi:M20 family metallopeptidase [Dactylosporangium sp. NPDC000244]|uniref:M20 family metallopeptidase n=1 Tax=Dactylosporangium sp. NPDC000244 TaxID=3154365 RepID=UPI003327C87D
MPHPLQALQVRLPDLLADLEELIRAESPTADRLASARCADTVAALGARLTGAEPERLAEGGSVQLRWRFGAGDRVLLLGHCDTVWPLGTLATHPFTVSDGRLTGPGCYDMKAGLVQMFHALAVLDSLDGVTVLVTTDEEHGSPDSRDLIEAEARRVRAALVLEASGPGGALKTARKGVSTYDLRVVGRAAHAGLDPHLGINTTMELAHQVLAIAGLADPASGTTVTPTVMASGTTRNTVPDAGELQLDVRVATIAEQHRVDAAMRARQPVTPGARLELAGGPNRPPMEERSSADLFARAARIHEELGLGQLHGLAVGGASDGNLTAGAGTPTLDGLGAVGGGAHADDEHVSVEHLPQRAALLAVLVRDLLAPGSKD